MGSIQNAATNKLATSPQTLLIDADDTLWENNVYFERAIAAFISYLDHRVHTRGAVGGASCRCAGAAAAARPRRWYLTGRGQAAERRATGPLRSARRTFAALPATW